MMRPRSNSESKDVIRLVNRRNGELTPDNIADILDVKKGVMEIRIKVLIRNGDLIIRDRKVWISENSNLLEQLSITAPHDWQIDRAIQDKVRSDISKDYAIVFLKIGRRDGFYCNICHKATADLEIDHIKPVSKGGNNSFNNLQLLCSECNKEKAAKYNG